jgi:tocopherol O-methyltransferase
MHHFDSTKDYHHQNTSKQIEASNDELLVDTVHYYNECHNDYLFAWCNTQNLALHYGYWDQESPYNHHQALLNTNQVLYDSANIQSSDQILDSGCGLGGSSLWLASQHQNRVTGITISDKQVYYARKHARRRNLGHLADFQLADYCHTPFEDKSYDVVWALESACYALDKKAFLQEAYRLLNNGGRLALCDAFMLQQDFDEKQWQTVQTFLQGWVVPNLSSRAQFIRLLEEVGFKNIQVTDISRQILPSSKHMHKVAKRLQPVQKISQWLGLRSEGQTANYKVGYAQYDFFHEPLAEYCVFTAQK